MRTRVDTPGAGRRGLESNRAFILSAGMTSERARREPFDHALRPDTDKCTLPRIRHASSCVQMFSGERLCHPFNGAPCWNDLIVMPDPAPTDSDATTVALFLDVTTRPTAGYAAGASAAEKRLTINLIPAGIVVHSFSGELTYATAKATRLPGVPYDTAIGALITDLRRQFIREDGSVLPIEECPVSSASSTRALIRNIVLGFTRDGSQPWVWRCGTGSRWRLVATAIGSGQAIHVAPQAPHDPLMDTALMPVPAATVPAATSTAATLPAATLPAAAGTGIVPDVGMKCRSGSFCTPYTTAATYDAPHTR